MIEQLRLHRYTPTDQLTSYQFLNIWQFTSVVLFFIIDYLMTISNYLKTPGN